MSGAGYAGPDYTRLGAVERSKPSHRADHSPSSRSDETAFSAVNHVVTERRPRRHRCALSSIRGGTPFLWIAILSRGFPSSGSREVSHPRAAWPPRLPCALSSASGEGLRMTPLNPPRGRTTQRGRGRNPPAREASPGRARGRAAHPHPGRAACTKRDAHALHLDERRCPPDHGVGSVCCEANDLPRLDLDSASSCARLPSQAGSSAGGVSSRSGARARIALGRLRSSRMRPSGVARC